MPCSGKYSITVFAVLALIMLAIVPFGAAHAGSNSDVQLVERTDSLDGPTEPSKLLTIIDARRAQRDSLFAISPLGPMRDATGVLKKDLYDNTGIKLGAMFSHVFQGISDSIGNEDKYGTSSVLYLLGSWDLLNKGKPNMGQLVFTVEGRWDYGTTGPEDLGTYSLGSAIGTADTFSKYSPAFLLRELYWRQGSPEAGWAYRFGKITPDAILSSSEHLSPYDNFLPSGGTGPFAIALPDSGLGAVGAWYINDRMALAGLVSDANADRFDFGDPDEGDLFAAGEFHFKVAPQTSKAGFSKITLWHTDGTKNGQPANGENGPSGWGYYVKLEQELTADGRLIGILRYGNSYNDSAAYEKQGSAHLLLYEPRILTGLKNDLIGIAFNWARLPQSGTRDEYHAELFYKFPIIPNVDTTLSYQSVIHPATTRKIDHASVFSLRFRTVF